MTVRDLTSFGAVSGQDSTQALLEARDWSAATPGAVLHVPVGTFHVGALVEFSAPTRIVGAGGGWGDYSTMLRLGTSGRLLFGSGASGSRLSGIAVGGWTNAVCAGPAVEARCQMSLERVAFTSASVGLALNGQHGIGNVNALVARDLVFSECTYGVQLWGTDANSVRVSDARCINCDVGFWVRAHLGNSSFVGCFAECPSGRGWDVQPHAGQTQIVACYDESRDAPIVCHPARLIGCATYQPHTGAAGINPAEALGSLTPALFVEVRHRYLGSPTEPLLYVQQGDPQQLGERVRRVYLDGQPFGRPSYTYEEAIPYTGPTHGPYLEARAPGKQAWRVLLADTGSHERGTVHAPRLLVGGSTATATGWAPSTASAVDVAAKLAELEQRIAALE